MKAGRESRGRYMETKTKKEKNAILQMILPAVILVAFSLVVLSMYSKRLNKIFDTTLDEQMRETAVLYSIRMRQEVTNLAVAADPAADVMASGKEAENNYLKALAENTHADRVALLEPDGSGIDSKQQAVTYDPDSYRVGVQLGKSTYHYFGEGVIGVITPVMKDGAIAKLILQEYHTERLNEQLNNFNFGKETWVILMDDNGSIMYLFGGNAPDYLAVDENFIETVSEMKSSDIVNFLDNLTKDISGSLRLDFNGDRRAVFYKSMGINDWYLLIGVPESYMELQNASKSQTVTEMMYWIMAGVALFVFMIVFIGVMDRIRRKVKSDGLIQLAETDQLTNLYNKVTTEKKIKEFIAEHPDTQSLIFVLDIDNFKKINDTMGHAFGDEVLRTIGQRIRMEFRASDIIGRAGGDEFIIFLKGLKEEEIIIREAAKVENFFKDFKAGEGYVKYSATASIGCAVFPRDAADFEGLYKAADQALYKAKQRGKNQLAFYKDPEGFGQSV